MTNEKKLEKELKLALRIEEKKEKKNIRNCSPKLKKKAILTVCSILATLSVMAVGVLATFKEFKVNLSNQVSISIENSRVNGVLAAKRTGQVKYASDVANTSLTANSSAVIADWLELYNSTDGVDGLQYADKIDPNTSTTNMDILTSSVIIDEDAIKNEAQENHATVGGITYIYKYVCDAGSTNNTKITIKKTADISVERAEIVYQYIFSETEPADWSSATKVTAEMFESNEYDIIVGGARNSVYIRASLDIDLTRSISIGETSWGYELKFSFTDQSVPLAVPNASINNGILTIVGDGETENYKVYAKSQTETTGTNPTPTALRNITQETSAEYGTLLWEGSAEQSSSMPTLSSLMQTNSLDSGRYIINVVGEADGFVSSVKSTDCSYNNFLDIYEEGGEFFVDMGKYPQTYAGSTLNAQLESAYNNGSLRNGMVENVGEVYSTKANATDADLAKSYTFNGLSYARKQTIVTYNSSSKYEDTSTPDTTQPAWFKIEPIKWRVMGYYNDQTYTEYTRGCGATTNLVLMADKLLTAMRFDDSASVGTGSEIRNWLNSDETSSQGFLEESAIETCSNIGINIAEVENVGFAGDTASTDKVWLFSQAEAENTINFADTNSRSVSPSDFAVANNCLINSSRLSHSWLRSRKSQGTTTVQRITIEMAIANSVLTNSYYGVRPVIKINATPIVAVETLAITDTQESPFLTLSGNQLTIRSVNNAKSYTILAQAEGSAQTTITSIKDVSDPIDLRGLFEALSKEVDSYVISVLVQDYTGAVKMVQLSQEYEYGSIFEYCNLEYVPIAGESTVDYFKISSVEDLDTLCTLVNSNQSFVDGGETKYFKSQSYKQMANIADVKIGTAPEGQSWVSNMSNCIGVSSTNAFAGTYNGNGYEITSLTINKSDTDYVGLFGYINGATLTNIVIAGGSVVGNINVGGLCGYAGSGSSMISCSNSATVHGVERVGGICGNGYGFNINCCTNLGAVSGTSSVGGICGTGDSRTITKCSNLGIISGETSVGGICGGAGAGVHITTCYNVGNIVRTSGSANSFAYIYPHYSSYNDTYTNCFYWSESTITDSTPSSPSATADPGTIVAVSNAENLLSYLNQVLDTSQTQYAWAINAQINGGWPYVTSEELAVTLWSDYKNDFEQGTGTREDPYEVGTAAQLAKVADNLSAHYVQTADIDLDGHYWTPIGSSYSIYFSGTYDGGGYSISNLDIVRGVTDFVGLFGSINGAGLKNINISSGSIAGNINVGGICGYAGGGSTMILCFNSATVNGVERVGGICGNGYGFNINCCSNLGSVSGTSSVGGICGTGDSRTTTKCSNLGTVSGISCVGGVCGAGGAGASIGACYNVGNIVRLSGNDTSFGFVSGASIDITSTCYRWSSSTITDAFGGSGVMPVDSSTSVSDQSAMLTALGTTEWEIDAAINNGWPHALFVDMWDFHMASSFAQGAGTQANPYQISNASELVRMKTNLSSCYLQTANIDLENILWTPIGDYGNKFTGTFDGGGYTISNLNISKSGSSSVGLFGYVQQVTLRNITIASGNVVGGSGVGAICGSADGTISNCSNAALVNGNSSVGGICGIGAPSGGTTKLNNCSNYGAVSGGSNVGGICGASYHVQITNCFNTASIGGTGSVGGISGYDGEVSNCYNTGSVEITSGTATTVGCICGQYGTIINSYDYYSMIGYGGDSVGLMSNSEATNTSIFADNNARKATPTDFALANYADGSWWLSTPGSSEWTQYYIWSGGGVDGSSSTAIVGYNYGVRPSMIINKGELTILGNAQDGYYVEIGKYPQLYVGSSLNQTLETAFQNSELTAVAGETYTVPMGTSEFTVVDVEYLAYSYGGKTYVRQPITSARSSSVVYSDNSSVATYSEASPTVSWFEVKPIRWRVLGYYDSLSSFGAYTEGCGVTTNLFVLSDQVLASTKFDDSSNDWRSSDIRSWLNAGDTGISATKGFFVDSGLDEYSANISKRIYTEILSPTGVTKFMASSQGGTTTSAVTVGSYTGNDLLSLLNAYVTANPSLGLSAWEIRAGVNGGLPVFVLPASGD